MNAAKVTLTSTILAAAVGLALGLAAAPAVADKPDCELDPNHHGCGGEDPDRDNSGRGKDVPLIVTLDDMGVDNLVSDDFGSEPAPYSDDERGVSAFAGGQLPPRIQVGAFDP